jgi:hypothetical protein
MGEDDLCLRSWTKKPPDRVELEKEWVMLATMRKHGWLYTEPLS